MIGAAGASAAGAGVFTDTTVDFNADLSGYVTPLSSALEITQQYAAAANGLVGVLAKVDAAMIGVVRRTTALAGGNKIGVALAADYQHQLEGIAATTAVVGKGQAALSKSTMQLARDFPIGMGRAVQTVQALQESGATTVKTIKALSVESTKLSAATGFGPELSRDMLQLNRQMGNSTEQFSKLSDSLVTTTKLWGANAGATVQFSKAIAPVAASVGMSETKVLGLSAAMSRLGEDGYAGATAVNKVLLDMSKSIRTGSPELREYASLLGTSADQLERMFKADPTATLSKFVKSVGAQGTQSQRALDQLGLDGVRTTRAINSLAGSGDLDKIINTSVNAYGDGSTDKAAHAAFHGVTNEMTRMQESMQQTVANGGKPFLGMLDLILKGANGVASAIAKISGSSIVQAIAGPMIAAGLAGTIAMKGVSALSTVGLAERGIRAVGNSAFGQNFAAGRAVPVGPLPDGLGAGGRLGQWWAQNGIGAIGGAPGAGGVGGVPGALLRGATSTGRGFANWAALGIEQVANDFRTVRGGPARTTPAGTALRAGMGDAWRDFSASPTLGNLGTQTAAAGRALGAFAKDTTLAGSSVARLTRATLAAGGSAISYGAGGAGALARGAGRVAGGASSLLGAIGVTPLLAGVGALAGTAVVASQLRNNAKAQDEQIREDASSSIYGRYNDFAESIGAASRGLISFEQVVTQLSGTVTSAVSTISSATKLTGDQAGAALAPGYKAAFKIAGGASSASVSSVAAQAGSVLGAQADPTAVNRIVMDIANQKGVDFANQVGTKLNAMYGSGGTGPDYGAGLDEMSRLQKQTWFSSRRTNKEAGDQITGVVQGAEQRAAAVGNVYGGQAATAASLTEAQKYYGAVQSRVQGGKIKPGTREYDMAFEGLANLLGVSGEDLGKTGMDIAGEGLVGGPFQQSWDEFIKNSRQTQDRQKGKVNLSYLSNIDTLKQKGYNLGDDYTALSGTPYSQQVLQDASQAFYDLAQSGGSAAKSLFGVNDRAKELGVTTDKLNDAQKADLNNTSRAFGDLQLRPDDRRAAQRAGSTLAGDLKVSNKDTSLASLDLASILENVANIDPKRRGVEAAAAYLQQQKVAEDAQLRNSQIWMRDRRAASVATQMGPQQDEAAESARQGAISAGQQSAVSELSFAKQFIEAATSTQRQIKRMEEDNATARMRATRDFNRQRAWSEQDYQRQVKWSTEDFQKSMLYTEQDYQKARGRAARDFNLQQAWAQQDFNTSQRRAMEDHAKQLQRSAQDASKSFYDPFQRRQAQTVWDAPGLLTNLADQRQAMDKQLAGVKQLKGMGLNQAVIDNLGLMEAGNAQQVDRMLADLMSDPSLISKINAEIAKRTKSAGAMTNTDLNEGFRRGEEDFQKSLARMQEDFTKSVNRARKQFNTSMADMAKDSATARERAQKQFDLQMARGAEQFRTQMARSATQFHTSLADMAADLKRSEARAFEDLSRFGEQLSGDIVDTKNRFLTAMARMPASARAQLNSNLKALVKDMHTNFVKEFNTAFAGEGITAGSVSGGSVSPPNAGGDQGPSKTASNNGNVGTVKSIAGKYGWGSGAEWNALYQLVQHESGFRNTAQNPTSTAYGMFQFLNSTWKTVGATKTSDPAKQTEAGLKYIKQRYGDPIKAWSAWQSRSPHWYGDGAIFSSGPKVIGVGERGPEAVIPLNGRGIDVLAAAFSKWATNADVMRARMSPYASSAPGGGGGAVYTYDQRVQYTGDVVVQAPDASAMERSLRAKQRRSRALQPMGSR